MEKRQFNIVPKQTKRIPASDFGSNGDNEIEISLYIGAEDKFHIISQYVNDLFSTEDMVIGYETAEQKLIFSILSSNTNIDIGLGTDEETNRRKIDAIFTSGLWNVIKGYILNYEDMRKEIREVVDLAIKEQQSFKNIFNSITEFVDKFLSSDKMKELSEQLKEQAKEVGKFYPNVKIDDEKIIKDEVIENNLVEESNEPIKKQRKTRVKKS